GLARYRPDHDDLDGKGERGVEDWQRGSTRSIPARSAVPSTARIIRPTPPTSKGDRAHRLASCRDPNLFAPTLSAPSCGANCHQATLLDDTISHGVRSRAGLATAMRSSASNAPHEVTRR